MLAYALVLLPVVTAFDTSRSEAFLVATPEEKMGPNMHFEPLSTTMKCVISLTLQYIIVYTALGISRSYCDFKEIPHKDSAVQQALKDASGTMFFAPMACLMFIGFRMRVLQLTQGEGNPQNWCRMAMLAVMYAIGANTLIAMIIPVFTDHKVQLQEGTGEMKLTDENPFKNPVMQIVFVVIRYFVFLGLYVGFGAVIVGVYLFEPPKGLWEGPVPEVSPAVACTVTLSIAFFSVYLLMAISRSYTQFAAGSTETTKFEEVMSMAANSMAMAPMLCVLFLACRMRALQMDPMYGNPQRWAQNCFYACTYAIIVQTCVAVFVPLCLGGKMSKGRTEGDLEIEGVTGWMAKGLTALRFFVMLCVYAGALAVVCAAFTMEHPKGKEYTIPVSPTMHCVTNLSFQYFFIYILLWVLITVEDLTSWKFEGIRDAVESAKSTVQFAPMLCVLFIATRMRALQISDNKGAPQGWAQDGMYLASWSLLIQFLMCLIMPLFTGATYQTDSLDGSVSATKEPVKNQMGAYVVTVVRYLALIALYVGVICVITSVFTITPETANGRGSIPVLGDDTLGVDLVPGAPPSITDAPGVEGAMKTTGSTVGSGADALDSAGGTVSDTTSAVVPGF